MKNWAGNLQFTPTQVLAPKSTEEAQSIVKDHLQKNKSIRMRGSSHSWTGLIATNDTYLHLDEMQGLIHIDAENNQVTAKAGTKLKLFGAESFKHKLSLPNQGDVDHQSVAGALSTGTHGTGITLQSMANQVRGLTLISGTGEVVKVNKNENSHLVNALSVSFGSAGLITEATMQLVPAYKLKVDILPEEMSQALNKFSDRLKNNRHLEMFYFPVGDWSLVKLMNITTDNETSSGAFDKISEMVLENWVFEGFNILAQKTKKYSAIDKIVRKFVDNKTFVNWSHKAFPTERTVRFMEMEYNLPVEKFESVFEEIKWTIKKEKFETLFPIEIRFVKGDELWLSPAYQRDSVYFAIHTYITEDFRPYFEAMEKIFKRHGGRPHWGKWHSLTGNTLHEVYPKFHDFLKVRNELDPKGLWLNDHLKSLFIYEPKKL